MAREQWLHEKGAQFGVDLTSQRVAFRNHTRNLRARNTAVCATSLPQIELQRFPPDCPSGTDSESDTGEQ